MATETNSLINAIAQKLNASTNQLQIAAVSGGSINKTIKISVKNNLQYFVKINNAKTFPDLFLKEKNGLQFLQKQHIFITPNVIDHFLIDDQQVLIMEWIESGNPTKTFWQTFGKSVAALHSVTDNSFGFNHNNYLGSVVQTNTPTQNWTDFFINQRLEPLIKLCAAKGLLNTNHIAKFQSLYKHLPSIYNIEKPSLLHGDLWSGNYMCNQNNQPVLIDPAVYFGHRSIDLGMTTLFGGFDKTFYEAYQYYHPLPNNYKEQWQVSNLYPLLIHLFLFGTSYLHSIEGVLNTYG